MIQYSLVRGSLFSADIVAMAEARTGPLGAPVGRICSRSLKQDPDVVVESSRVREAERYALKQEPVQQPHHHTGTTLRVCLRRHSADCLTAP